MSDYLDINNEELLKDFFSEAEQQVEQLESNILVIEQDPDNHEAIDEIFRAAHTLKGGSATVEMQELSTFTHAMEDLLDALRSGTVKVNEPVVDTLLTSLDVIKAMLAARAEGTVYSDDVSDLLNLIRSYIPGKSESVSANKTATPKPRSEKKVAKTEVSKILGESPASLLSEYEMLEIKDALLSGQKLYAITVHFDESNLMNTVGGIQVFATLKQVGTVLKTVPDFDALYEDIFQEYVVYFIASGNNKASIEETAFIPDVTLTVEVIEVSLSADLEPIPAPTPAPVKETAKEPAQEKVASAKAAPDAPKKAMVKISHAQTGSSHTAGAILRVDAKRIDYLLNLVSETVITKAALNQSSIEFNELYTMFQTANAGYKEKLRKFIDKMPTYLEKIQNGVDINSIKKEVSSDYLGILDVFSGFEGNLKSSVTKFRSASQNLGRISGELQEGVMKIRMVPISQIFSRFPRVVRDLSKDLKKNVQLVIEGEDTELDKSVVEDLLDPIMHCVRNSLDHGIETPEVRKKFGKPEQGTLLLKASNEGNMIVIEISDDGHGIDVDSVKAKAVERGILHPGKNLTDIEAFQLIFAPGFSTSKKVSSVSGRGVGLDVVKTHIEKLNGTVTVNSEPNLGTRFIIKLPLTLAIIQGLLIRVGEEVYSIPITSVIESHRVKVEDISRIDNYEVFNVRDEVISLLRLNRLFGIASDEVLEDDYHYIVIVGTADKKVGLMVDSLIGEEDVVIKPLKDQFTSSPGIAGASILGDGSVSLIIDVSRLLELGMQQEIRAREQREASAW
ncbi:chemotaxis protein CheA [Treponema phagedenis]|uniref:Chemotaxis protein CheA n=1 Tax=Treponema phagedenis TaxID=162 RepID=A0A0B7GWL2_TREPH|nr:chemotaxis protein CheA [Treponema phagedenis]QEJ94334.1 chemotaxis protein CheA [Treponema phagedenis]QEJ98989.1 chemotaxis protein CheA [Treponema phagedenis]QEK00296.1 chemotaxis protein CheA [Treponema phagedenis]QEK04497.1 chemotaxis protein CheA [Treponema phagedenis]QEK07788.1 chemotaxis protein CheA [Treponema phagedenis]